MNNHAKLSASGSERWILCPGSVKAEEGLPNTTSPYAEEGILAHEVAAKILNGGLWEEFGEEIDHEMIDNVTNYINYINIVKDQKSNVQKLHKGASLLIEQRVDFSHVVPEGFGTADCILKDDKTLHVIDLKYGKGIPVYAEENTQLLLYAIGSLQLFDKYIPENIVMHIVQPRIDNYSKWSITFEELLKWIAFLNEKALAALKPDAIRIPHRDACRWCKAKPTCPALYDFINYNVLPLKEKTNLNDKELKLILDNSKLITDFLSSVEQLVYDKLSLGNQFDGYKLVNGRSSRKFKTTNLNEDQQALIDSLFKEVPMTLAEAEKLLGKDTVNDLTYKQESKPVLVKSDDKRSAIVSFQFDNEIEKGDK